MTLFLWLCIVFKKFQRYVWGLPLPKLVVTVHGGSLNFDLPSRLGKIFQNGMLKVAHTTSAWVISSGLNSGVSKHLGNALNNRWFGDSKRRHVVSIGIAPVHTYVNNYTVLEF